MQVVAGDIFYDAAAGFDLRAGAIDEFGAEKKIASSAVGVAERRIESRGDGAADCGLRNSRERGAGEIDCARAASR